MLEQGQSFGDYDGDGDVDGGDFFAFSGCMTGPAGGPLPSGCEAFDFPNTASGTDGFVDMADFDAFMRSTTGEGGCAPVGPGDKKWYCSVTRTGNATGCSAKITMHSAQLCGSPTSTVETASSAWVGVTRKNGSETPLHWAWAQVGYFWNRNQGSTAVNRHWFFELKIPDAAPARYLGQSGTPPMGEPHYHRCWIVNPANGTWRFQLDNDPNPPELTHPYWSNKTGEYYHWETEIWHRSNQMFGIQGNKCKFTECEYELDHSGFQPMNFRAPGVLLHCDEGNDQNSEWGIEHGVSDQAIQIWDRKP